MAGGSSQLQTLLADTTALALGQETVSTFHAWWAFMESFCMKGTTEERELTERYWNSLIELRDSRDISEAYFQDQQAIVSGLL